jgi:hypothetical protein
VPAPALGRRCGHRGACPDKREQPDFSAEWTPLRRLWWIKATIARTRVVSPLETAATSACAWFAPGGRGGGVAAAVSSGGASPSAPSGQPAAAAPSGRQPLVNPLDRRMSELLHAAAEAGSAAEQQSFLTEVREAVWQLRKFVESHRVRDHLNGNPFHPVAIAKTMKASLAAVTSTVR